MGILISGEETGPYPRRSWLILTCDGDHGLLPAVSQRFDQDGYIAQHAAAMRAGWKETHDRGRIFLCPECSGKTVREPR
jgi:hypothetical protein